MQFIDFAPGSFEQTWQWKNLDDDKALKPFGQAYFFQLLFVNCFCCYHCVGFCGLSWLCDVVRCVL